MAYMHKEIFEIFFEVYDAVTPDAYFFVDDLIALPIQALNRKGYTTAFCCAGHPFTRQFEDEIVPCSDPIEYNREYNKMQCQSYISFSEGVTFLPEIPRGFYKDTGASGYNLVIRKDYEYDGSDVYGIMHVIVDTMKQLYEWTLSLPDYSRL
jgi:hypothetical protein